MASLSDTDLRARLIELGHPPGPITATTRGLYLRKLEQLSRTLDTKKASSSAPNSYKPSSHAPALLPRGALEDTRPKTPPLDDVAGPPLPSAPPPDCSLPTNGNPASSSGAGASVVVFNLLGVLADSSHPANDTALVFRDNSVLLVSRAVLSSQCSRLIPLLYSSEEPFAVTVVTLTGRSSQYHVRYSEYVTDLKERLSLTQGILVEEQRLVYLNNELVDMATISDCGVQPGATIHLVLITTVEPRPPPLALPGPSPWLSIAHLRVELGLEHFQQPTSSQAPPTPTTLPHHTAHILHIYDIPREGLQLFVRLLYTGQVDGEGNLSCVVVVYILCVYFDLSSLAEMCLSVIREQLTVALATELLTYAVSVQCQPLKDLCVSVIGRT